VDLLHPDEDAHAPKPARPKRPGRWVRRVIYVLLALVAVWLCGDLMYSAITHYRLGRWQATKKWTTDYIRADGQPFEMGHGRTAVLLVHGFNDSPAIWRQFAPRLAEHGLHVRAMRLPGFAGTIEKYEHATRENWIQAVAAEIAELRKTHDRVCAVGHSLGGAILLNHLLEKPGSIDAAVLLAPPIAVNNRRSPVLSVRTWHRISRRLLLFTRVVENFMPLDAHSEEAQRYDGHNKYYPIRVNDSLFATLDRLQGQAANIETPVLMILSREDAIINTPAAAAYFEQLGSSAKRLEYATDAGHMLPIDNGWQQLADQAAAFLKQPDASKPEA